jgi:DNA-binding NtrC family response regulator
MSRILLIDDDKTARKGLYFILRSVVDEVIEAESVDETEKVLSKIQFDVVISDLRIPKEEDGLNLVKKIKQTQPITPILMITAYGSVDSAVKAIKAGAFDYITKDFTKEEIVLKIEKLLNTRKLWLSNLRLSQEVKALKNQNFFNVKNDEIIGNSPEITKVLDVIKRIAVDKDSTVLLQGESGTGKELVAKSIHNNTPERNKNKFIVVDVASMPTTLLESQLFGHEKGSFTDAKEKHIGYFEEAMHGTVFLDEIGDFPVELQVKLLRFLQEKTIVRVGGVEQIFADVRIIAATNKNLEELVARGEFRKDLYYRLKVVSLVIPSLKERKEDIRELIEYFINKFEIIKNRKLIFPNEVIDKMIEYDWPGNVRQLKNLIESLYILVPFDKVKEEDLQFETPESTYLVNDLPDTISNLSFKDAKQSVLEKFEYDYIRHHLKKYNGNISKLAAEIGISREGLSKKIKNYNLKNT